MRTVKSLKLVKPSDVIMGKADALGFFETIALNGLENKSLKLSSAFQRHFFGNAVFGKKTVFVHSDGKFIVGRKVCFGTDFDSSDYRWDQFQRCFVWASDMSKVDPARILSAGCLNIKSKD